MSDTMTTALSAIGEAALELAGLGYDVFPCVPGTKRPMTKRGFHDAARDADTIRAWWEARPDANVAIAAAGLIVVDVDLGEKGEANPWLQDQPQRLAELQAAPSATTPRGGRHYYFKYEGNDLHISASGIAPKVDIRTSGGYVVTAPSRTADGIYAWAAGRAPRSEALPPAPDWLVGLIRASSGTKKKRAKKSELIFEGGRNDALTRMGGGLRRRGLEEHEIKARLLEENARRCVPPLDPSEIESIAASVSKYPPGPVVRADVPEVEIGADEHRVNDEVVAALAGHPDMYQRGGRLVRVLPRGQEIGADGGYTIGEIELATLREIITERVALVAFDRKGDLRPAHPPEWLVAAVLRRGVWPGIRPLLAIADSPVLRPDGTVVNDPGYDASTGVLYIPSGQFPPVHPEAALDDADAAVEELLEVVRDFTFESAWHRSGWLAMVLTAAARHAFAGPAPLFLIDANIRGAGKTLLAQSAGLIALGRIVPTTSYAANTEELRKQITMTALEGEPLVIFDNIAGAFGNDTLDRALTTTRWRDRRLGGNSKVDAPLVTTWSATGNNVCVQADTTRRIVHVRLRVMDEHPEDRSGFAHKNLLAYVATVRRRLYTAALTILSAYMRNGSPDQKLRPMGSFEGWSRLVRSALVWCGQSDPCLGRDGLEVVADSGVEIGRTLIEAWRGLDPHNHGLVISDVVARVNSSTPAADETLAAMKSALEQLVGGNKQLNARSVGNKLKGLRDRVYDGVYLSCDASKSAKGKLWRLKSVGSADSVTLVTLPPVGGDKNVGGETDRGVTL